MLFIISPKFIMAGHRNRLDVAEHTREKRAPSSYTRVT